MSLNNKNIIFLGSSVTEGYAADGVSFVDILEKQYGLTVIKEAVSGTTLIDKETRGKASYVTRMRQIPKNFPADAFVCQLSTNDATQGAPLGLVSDECQDRMPAADTYDVMTVAGAMEYIISYARHTWNCPVIFYTGTKYDSQAYEKMVHILYELKDKYGIFIIDLWNDEEMNQVSKEDYKRFMADPIHPTYVGYQKWWSPKIAASLERILK